VFFTIAATVCACGAWASALAGLLRVRAQRPQGVLLVGVNAWSLALAEELRSWGRPVLFLDNNPAQGEAARGQGFAVCPGDATSRETYRQLDLTPYGVLVAMTPNDAVNTLACEAAGAWLGPEGLLQILSKPAGAAPHSRVRLGGRWAMPAQRSHREIAELLAQRRLYLATEAFQAPTVLTAGLMTSKGPMIPLLVVDGGRLHIAVEGQTCSAHAVIVGLLPRDLAQAATGGAEDQPPPSARLGRAG
jgi:hypothetical protein